MRGGLGGDCEVGGRRERGGCGGLLREGFDNSSSGFLTTGYTFKIVRLRPHFDVDIHSTKLAKGVVKEHRDRGLVFSHFKSWCKSRPWMKQIQQE